MIVYYNVVVVRKEYVMDSTKTLTVDVINARRILRFCPYYDDIINYDILSNENNRSLIVIKKNNESSKVVNYAKLLKQSENRKKKLNLK